MASDISNYGLDARVRMQRRCRSGAYVRRIIDGVNEQGNTNRRRKQVTVWMCS